MTSAAASCPSATRALSAERARRTRFASCRACAGCERVARLFALIDSLPVCRWNSAPRAPLSRGDRGHNRLSAALAALHAVPGPAPIERGDGSRALRSEGWPAARLREQQNWSHKHPRVDSPSHRPHGQNERARLVHTDVHVTLARSTFPTHPRVGATARSIDIQQTRRRCCIRARASEASSRPARRLVSRRSGSPRPTASSRAGAASKRPEARKRKRRSRRKSLMLGTIGSSACAARDVNGHRFLPTGGHLIPHWWPSFLPAGGHRISPPVAIVSPQQGLGWVQVRGLTPLPAVACASR